MLTSQRDSRRHAWVLKFFAGQVTDVFSLLNVPGDLCCHVFFPAHLRHDVCGYMIYGPTISNVRLVCFYRPGTGSAFRSRAAEPIRFTESDVGKMWQKPLDISLYYKHSLMYICTLWLFNIAMENGPFIDGLPGFTYWKWWLSMAMLNNQMVYLMVKHGFQ
jgi:hypothetical protein